MELLRYDTMFTCHRQDVFNSLANKVLFEGLLNMAKVDQTKKLAGYWALQKRCHLVQIKIQSEYFMAIMLQKILISGPNLNNTLKRHSWVESSRG